MIYKLEFTHTALTSLKKLDKSVATKVLSKLEWLSENLDLVRPVSLKGDFSGMFKLRVGNYRVIYSIDYENFLITVHYVGHRREIYKGK